ncbi:MAG: hypothetical protein K5660_03375 [Paludibacteraceae bacterium]|nr:hypothetical protein [Paludibacteraceae bacterium]
MKLDEHDIRRLRRKFCSTVIANWMTGDILTWLRSVLCTSEDEVMSVFDGRELTDKQWLRKQLENIPDGYIVFTHLSEIPDGRDSDSIKGIIYYCIHGDWRMGGFTFSEEWMNALAQKPKSIGVIAISEQDEYKTSRDFHSVIGRSSCVYIVITDNGLEHVE